MYDLPQFNFNSFKEKASQILHNKILQALVLVAIIIIAIGFSVGTISVDRVKKEVNALFLRIEKNLPFADEKGVQDEKYISHVSYEQAIIDSVRSASPSVVSIIISKNLPVYEEQFINPFEDFPGYNNTYYRRRSGPY